MKTTVYTLLAAIESTEDTDAAPAAANAILTTGITPALYEGNRVSRDLDRAYFGAQDQINVNPHMGLQFGVEYAGAGSVDGVPGFDPLLRVCGLVPTVNAGTSVAYSLVSDNIQSLSAYFLRGTQLHKMTGCRGNLAIDLTAGQIPKFNFDNLLGSYYTPVSTAAVVADYSAFTVPSAVTKDNTPTVTIDGFSACLQSLNMNLNNQVTRRNNPGCRKTIIGGRAAGGQIVVRAPDLATKNFFSALESHAGITHVPIQIVHGTVAGHILDLSMPTVQLTGISETDMDGELGYQLDYLAIPTDAGNDELVLTTR